MDRSELTIVIAGALCAAVLVGWGLRWIFGRLNADARDPSRTFALAAELHAAEEALHRCETQLGEVESDARARLEQLQAELDTALNELERARAQTDEVRAAYRIAMAERDPAEP